MTIAEANEPLSNGLKIIIAQKGLKNLYVAENAGYTPQELSDMLNGRRLIKACNQSDHGCSGTVHRVYT